MRSHCADPGQHDDADRVIATHDVDYEDHADHPALVPPSSRIRIERARHADKLNHDANASAGSGADELVLLAVRSRALFATAPTLPTVSHFLPCAAGHC